MIALASLAESIMPPETILLFGAGASVRSGAPTGRDLRDFLGRTFGLNAAEYTLGELAALAELKRGRRDLLSALRTRLGPLSPAGGILNLPRYPWKSLYTTNYDTLIEQSYDRAGCPLKVVRSDFDFTTRDSAAATKLFKLHGSLEGDVSDGGPARLTITDADFDNTKTYRESLYDRLRAELAGSHLVIIGHSLQDPDIQEVAKRAIALGQSTYGANRVSLLLYTCDPDRAELFERRGFHVCFGSLDDFLLAIAPSASPKTVAESAEDPLSFAVSLRPTTLDVAHEAASPANVSAMLNGRPATYADIAAGFSFERTVAEEAAEFLETPGALCAVLLGAAGVGKTTAARQIIQRLRGNGVLAWEHRWDHTLQVPEWLTIAKQLEVSGRSGALFIDDAHAHLAQINELVDELGAAEIGCLKLLLASGQNHWQPRTKSPLLLKRGLQLPMARLRAEEIDRLLRLAETQPAIRDLAGQALSGFSYQERRRRLTDRCESEPFVCLKSIFASESFDDILLREFASLDDVHQDVYRHVAAIQSAGIRVHRQLIIRVLGIPADAISACLTHLAGIIDETTINAGEGLYGWQGRHPVIVAIIARYKFPDIDARVKLFRKVVENVAPTYPIEVRSLVEFCGSDSGLRSIPDRVLQNTLLAQIISVIPGERVPRHRLIRNLIEMGEYDRAETELRIFEKDLRRDGPSARYGVMLLRYRALRSPGVLNEDRLAILAEALNVAVASVQRFRYYLPLMVEYAEVAFQLFARTGQTTAYDEAMAAMRTAGEDSGDPEYTRAIARFEARMLGNDGTRGVTAHEEA